MQGASNTAGGRALPCMQMPAHRVCSGLSRIHRQRQVALTTRRALTTQNVVTVAGSTAEVCDLVLSSGFLAFAGHAGFLQAVDEAGIPIGGVMGTSAGALAGSLYCAGCTPQKIAKLLSEQTPASLLWPSASPWRGGALSLDGVVARLRDLLPPRFEDLDREFAVGVVSADGQHLLLDSGPLPEAVAASVAIPFIFEAVDVPGQSRHGPFKDGGVVDRVGLRAWRERRRAQMRQQRASHLNGNGNGNGNGHVSVAPMRLPPCLVHVIDRSSPFSGFDDMSATGESHILVLKSPRSGANFFDLGSFREAMEESRRRAAPHLIRLRRGSGSGGALGGSGAAAAPSQPAIRATIS